jgi:predicted nucleic acid-binding Zn ribbon protein
MDEIKEIVHNVIEKISQKSQNDQQKIYQAWEKTIKAKGLEHTKISGLKNQTLYVNVDSSAWLYQLNLQKTQILEAIQKDVPDIQKIYFKIGKAP